MAPRRASYALALRLLARPRQVAVEAKACSPCPEVSAYPRAGDALRAAPAVTLETMGGPPSGDEVLAATVLPARTKRARPGTPSLPAEAPRSPLAVHAVVIRRPPARAGPIARAYF